jgi:hypothetical protein
LSILLLISSGSVTYQGENRLRVYENRVLWRGFGYKREEAREGWRKLYTYNDGRDGLYMAPNIIMVIKEKGQQH